MRDMEFQFTMKFDLGSGSRSTDEIVERLGAAGCDDATVGLGRVGRVALLFTREAPTPELAIETALTDVRTALPEAELLEIRAEEWTTGTISG